MAELETQAQAAEGATETLQLDDFTTLLSKEFKPGTEAANQVNTAVTTLAQYALQDVTKISEDAVKSIEAIIASLDQKITEQLNLVMHHPDFQSLEAAWRGLHYLVNNTETDEMLKIRVMNISKKELGKTLKKFKGTAWDQSPMFKKIVRGRIRHLRRRAVRLPGRRLLFRSQSTRCRVVG